MLVVKNLPVNTGDARDTGLIPARGRYPGVGNGNPLQYTCLENSMDRGAWWATVHGIAKSQTWLSNWGLNILLCAYMTIYLPILLLMALCSFQILTVRNNATMNSVVHVVFLVFFFFFSIAKSCPSLCEPMDCNTAGSSVLHCPLEFAQIHAYWVNDAMCTCIPRSGIPGT